MFTGGYRRRRIYGKRLLLILAIFDDFLKRDIIPKEIPAWERSDGCFWAAEAGLYPHLGLTPWRRLIAFQNNAEKFRDGSY
jgi:hypothetical protein